MKTPTVTKEAMRLIHEGADAFADMEATGIRVDKDYLDRTDKEIAARMADLTAKLKADEVYRIWEKEFGGKTKLGNREQLAHVLFEKMDFVPKEYTEGGKDGKQRAKMDKTALDIIGLPFTENFLKLESMKKVSGTYLKGIRKEMVFDGRHWIVHPMYNLHTAVTYRSSCDKPNFTNIPIRNPDQAAIIRQCYIGRRHLVEVDFSGVEVKVAGCYNKDPNLLKYIKDKSTDMHRDMAMKIFMLAEDKVEKKTTRDVSKNMAVFPWFYGSVYFKIALDIWEAMHRRKFVYPGTDIPLVKYLADHGIKRRGECNPKKDPVPGTFEYHVKQIEREFWDRRFPVYKQWKQDWFRAYQRNGGFSMFTGFRVEGIYSRNDVTNYPIQGSAFHCLLWCIVYMNKWLRRMKMKSRIVGEIHDSLIADVPPNELQDFLHMAHHVMTVLLPKHWPWIIVPMEVECEVSGLEKSWYHKRQWVCKDGKWGPLEEKK